MTTSQHGRNPTPSERRILTSLAGGASRKETALAAGITVRAVTVSLEHLRDRYAPTNLSLMALAVKLEWIELPIWVAKEDPPPPPPMIARPPRMNASKPLKAKGKS